MRDVERVGDRRVDRQGALSQARAQRPAVEQFRHHERHAEVRPDVVHRDDVRMVQARRRAGFLSEASQPVRVAHVARRQDLQRDVAVQARVVRPVHLTHAPTRDQVVDLVRAELGSG